MSISLFTCLIAVLLTAQSVAAQAFQGSTDGVFRQEGIASWYGAQFEGRPTASGEIFNPNLFTAAHPTLPFGTFLIVTNRNNNRQVSVRVNDRGPFVEGRIIDVSQAAAEHLGMTVTGTAPVIIETIAIGQAQAAPPVQQPAPQVLIQPPQVQQPPQQVFAQPQQVPHQVFVPPPQVQPPPNRPVYVGTTTVPVEAPANTPITINIFHNPHDLSQPPAVEVVQTAPVVELLPEPDRIAVLPAPQAIPYIMAVEDFSPVPQQAVPIIPVSNMRTVQPPPVVEAMPIPIINANPNSTYRVQVGSFRVARNAVDTFVRLRGADFEPSYERSGEFFRVVLMGIRGTEVQSTVERLADMGYYGVIVMGE